jgi:hypothetical protein
MVGMILYKIDNNKNMIKTINILDEENIAKLRLILHFVERFNKQDEDIILAQTAQDIENLLNEMESDVEEIPQFEGTNELLDNLKIR